MVFLCVLAPLRGIILEIESRLEFNHASGERALRPPEVGVIDIRREESKRSKIQVVESIEEVCLHFKKRSLPKKRRHTGALPKTHVDRKVSWTTERVAADAGQQGAARIILIEIDQAATGKVSARTDERFVVGIFERAPKIPRRTRGTNEVVGIRRAYALPGVRRPRKPGVRTQYAV